jgi:hypothetical protein
MHVYPKTSLYPRWGHRATAQRGFWAGNGWDFQVENFFSGYRGFPVQAAYAVENHGSNAALERKKNHENSAHRTYVYCLMR